MTAHANCKRGDRAIVIGLVVDGTLQEPHEAIGRVVKLARSFQLGGALTWQLKRPLVIDIESDVFIDGVLVTAGSVIEVLAVSDAALQPISGGAVSDRQLRGEA